MKIKKLYLRSIALSLFVFPVFFTSNSMAAPKAANQSTAAKATADKATDKIATTKTPAEDKASTLEQTLTSMDKAAAGFKAIEADFAWDQYQKVVDETDTESGTIYFRRVGNEVQMMADITGPTPDKKKSVLFSDSKVQVYLPKADQVTIYNTNKNPDVESYLTLGFGGRGHDLSKSFDVSYLGSEKIGQVQTEKINLVPKSTKVKNNFDHIILWIDPSIGLSIQQQLFVPMSGDYRLAKYSNIKLKQKLPDNVFKLKTTGKTTILTP